MPSSEDHVLCEITDTGQVNRRKARCREHSDKLIEFYCKNCNVSHCQLCFADHHRECEDVVTIKSFVSNMKTELSELNHQLDEQAKKTNNFVEHQKIRLSQLNTDKVSVIDEIRCACQDAIELIMIKEKQLIGRLEDITNRKNNEPKAEVNQESIQVQPHKQAVSSEGDEAMDGGILSVVIFSQIVLDSLHVGEIVRTYLPTDVMSCPVLRESVDARTEKDEKVPDIGDITVLDVEDVQTTVITDCKNNCVKSFYKNKKTCHSTSCLQLDNRPMCIAQLDDNKVMVAVPDSNKIVTVAVTPDLILKTSFNTSKKYSSLAVMAPSRLAAGSFKCVDILNMQGEVVKSVTTHNNLELFKYPWFMCMDTTGHLLVSDWGKKTVTCLTSEGQTVWIHSGTGGRQLSWPRCITTTVEGDILVIDWTLKKLIQLSESGKYVRDVLILHEGLRYPEGIVVDKLGSLYICNIDKFLKFEFLRK